MWKVKKDSTSSFTQKNIGCSQHVKFSFLPFGCLLQPNLKKMITNVDKHND